MHSGTARMEDHWKLRYRTWSTSHATYRHFERSIKEFVEHVEGRFVPCKQCQWMTNIRWRWFFFGPEGVCARLLGGMTVDEPKSKQSLNCFKGLNIKLYLSSVWSQFRPLRGSKRSGRRFRLISSYFRPNPTPRCRAMTTSMTVLTTKKQRLL